MRTFIAIDIPEKIKKEIVKIQEQLPEFKGKITEKENLHLTLKFLGEVNEERLEEVKRKLKGIKLKQFETEIKDIGMFSERIIWLKMTNCNELQKEIDERLNYLFEEEKRFMGHLTIARVKELEDRKKFMIELRKMKIPEMKFAVKNFYLKKSKLGRPGPVYEDIKVYNLD
jgi:2'-5' RNA ligase